MMASAKWDCFDVDGGSTPHHEPQSIKNEDLRLGQSVVPASKKHRWLGQNPVFCDTQCEAQSKAQKNIESSKSLLQISSETACFNANGKRSIRA
jgi:hypothetical protein